MRTGEFGRVVVLCLVALVGLVGCGGSGTARSTAKASQPAPTYVSDCRAPDATGTASPSPGPVQYATMVVDGKLRDYRLYRPPTVAGTTAVPLVIVLHGSPIDAAGFEDVIHFQTEAATAGFVAVYPDGCDQDWDVSQNSYDKDFVGKVIDRLSTEFQIDRTRVYIVGGSAGAIMAYRLACDMADRIAAIASVAGTMLGSDCTPARPISILEMHGTLDANLPYQGGRSTYHGLSVPAVLDVTQRWATLDGCTGSPVSSQSGITKTSLWKRCNGGTVVRLDTVVGGNHTWFGSTYDPVPGEPSSNAEVWNFLKQFQLSR